MDKVNLVIDYSNMFMRSLYICLYSKKYNVSTFDTEDECGILVRKMAIDISYIVRIFRPDRVILACDSKPVWRKKLYDDLEGPGYKGTRTKDDTKNWDNINRSIDDLLNILNKHDFIVSKIQSAEADDIAALWKKESFNNNDSIILVSADKDWRQLVGFNSNNNNFCVCYNPVRGNKARNELYLTEDCLNWLEQPVQYPTDPLEALFFIPHTTYRGSFNFIREHNDIDFVTIDPIDILLSKIMCGDDADNAPSIYEYYKAGKKIRMTPGKSKKLLEDLNIHSVQDLCGSCASNRFLHAMEKSFKYTIDDIDMNERVMRQRKLVELNPDIFPEDITKSFEYHCKKYVDSGYMKNYNINMEFLLDGSKYLDDFDKITGAAQSSSIFTTIGDLSKYIPGI